MNASGDKDHGVDDDNIEEEEEEEKEEGGRIKRG